MRKNKIIIILKIDKGNTIVISDKIFLYKYLKVYNDHTKLASATALNLLLASNNNDLKVTFIESILLKKYHLHLNKNKYLLL